MLQGLRFGAVHSIVASLAMLIAFLACEALHEVTHLWLDDHAPHMHAVFVPFGVLVVLVWMYGWLSVLLVLPAALLSVYLMVGGAGMTVTIISIAVLKVLSVPLAFSLFAALGRDVRGDGRAANWRCVVMVGLCASVLGNVPRVVAGPMGGDSLAEMAQAMLTATAADIAGLIMVMMVVMLAFRLARHA